MCNQDCIIDGIEFKNEDWVMFSVWAVQHSDKFWEEPSAFKPERFAQTSQNFEHSKKINFFRFLPENNDKIIPYSFMPFGIGPRNCVGQRLAYLEAKIALLYVLRNFTPHKNAKTEIPLKLKVVSNLTATKNGIFVDFKKRDF